MKLRDYQTDIIELTNDFIDSDITKGQVYAPTGAGKTVCFTEAIKYAISKGMRSIAVVHPRIALSQDQLKRLKGDLGTAVHFTSFHSGGHVRGNEQVGEFSTTHPDVLRTVLTQTTLPHVTLSSYQSYHKLIEAGIKFDLVICDEAHYLVADQYRSVVNNFNSNKVIFYTATPITKEFDGGMDDEERFGTIIASVEPTKLIRDGFIVAPIIHQMNCESTKTSEVADIIDIIGRAYVEQYTRISSWGMPYHQMLVSARNVESDLAVVEQRTAELKAYIAKNTNIRALDIDVYTISSESSYCNGRVITERQVAINKIKTSNRNAIVVHFDTLSEGIDIDTLSGCVVMRSLSKPKFIQTVGRCARPYKGDLTVKGAPSKVLYNPDIMRDSRKKPRCIVTIPTVDNVVIGNIDATSIAEAFMIGGWGDLSTMLAESDGTVGGKNDVEFKLDDDSIFSAHITNHNSKFELENFFEILEG